MTPERIAEIRFRLNESVENVVLTYEEIESLLDVWEAANTLTRQIVGSRMDRCGEWNCYTVQFDSDQIGALRKALGKE